MIVNGASNTGTYGWTVPNTISGTQCLIRLSNYQYPSLTDVSNSTFTISTPITVTAANGGESWYGCSYYNITWTASTCIQRFYIYYSLNNGSTWNTITNQYNQSTYNTGTTTKT